MIFECGKIKQILYGVILMCIQTVLYAQPATEHSLNQLMSNIGAEMSELYPLVLSGRDLTPEEDKRIFESLNKLRDSFRQAEPHIKKKSPTYIFSYELLQDYLDTTIENANPVFLSPIRQKLLVLGDFCVSCHTQDDKFRTLFKKTKFRNFDSFLAYAEFNYATRNYIEAQAYYQKYLLLVPGLSKSEILKAIHRILSIHVQVLNQPGKVVPALDLLEKEAEFDQEIMSYIHDLRLAIISLSKEKIVQKADVSMSELEEMVSAYMGGINVGQPVMFTTPREEAGRLWLRGALFRYLNSGPEQQDIPVILYWLALCDRSLGYGYDYTLADFYIKQCVIKYSQHPFARRCFNEYKAYLKYYYTTPNEPVLPMEVDRELKALENYLK